MGSRNRRGKRKRKIQLELEKPWCYYCDRTFDDERVLLQHQRAKHFKCEECPRKFANSLALSTHCQQVHGHGLDRVPNAKEGCDRPDLLISGTQGIPENVVTARMISKLQQLLQETNDEVLKDEILQRLTDLSPESIPEEFRETTITNNPSTASTAILINPIRPTDASGTRTYDQPSMWTSHSSGNVVPPPPKLQFTTNLTPATINSTATTSKMVEEYRLFSNDTHSMEELRAMHKKYAIST